MDLDNYAYTRNDLFVILILIFETISIFIFSDFMFWFLNYYTTKQIF